MKFTHLLLIAFFPCLCLSQSKSQYPKDIELVLKKSGQNRFELEKAIKYYQKKGDPLKQKALYFLISNMDIHYSNNYYLTTSKGQKIKFNELSFKDSHASTQALDEIKHKVGAIHYVKTYSKDINTIKADFLIENIELAFKVKMSPYCSALKFSDFCEYVLPYRVSTEPLQDWRKVYTDRFRYIGTDPNIKSSDQAIPLFVADFKKWFSNTYGSEVRQDPIPRLGALQLLFRKKGACDDISDLVGFMFRSQGIPVSLDEVTYWATSTGNHYFNAVFNPMMTPSPLFDISNKVFTNSKFPREPAKVIRRTYSKQKSALASLLPTKEIPVGFMRDKNYIDVTESYWQTRNINGIFFNRKEKPKFAFLSTFNSAKWNPTWWTRVKNNSGIFTHMAKGAVYLPQYYINGQLSPAGYPIVNGYSRQAVLKPDLFSKTKVIIHEKEDYISFREGEGYLLFYWNNKWVSIGEKQVSSPTKVIEFTDVPKNALLLIRTTYTENKERPFTITPTGTIQWW